VPTPATGFAGIRKLEPGHTLTITDDDQEDALASPAIRVAEEPNANMTLEEAGEIAQIAIDDAVRRQLVADVPVGVFLSGGLDSAIVATLAGRHAGRRLSAFTVGFGQASYDETAPAATVAQAAGLEHHVLQLPDDPSDLVRETLDGFDEPFGDFSSVPMTWLCRQARKDVTVALSGDGGDEAFAGYPHYLMPGVARTFRRLPGFMRGAIAAVVNRWPASFERLSRDYMAKRFVRGAVYPPLQAHLMVKAIFFGEQRRHLFGPRLIEQLERDPMAGLGPQLGQSEGTAGTLVRKLLELDRRTFLLDDNLVKVDRTSMQASLEVRVPLLDRVVLNAADSIPTRLHAGGRRTKVVLREVARRLLPEEISGLQKKGFTPPMPAWLNGPLVPVLDEVLSESAVNAAGLVRFEAVNDLRKQHRDRTRECSRELWTLLSLHHWWARQGF
ncbi:MAG: asparagine synthase C-terminal domain-containing protein, partial [Acidobacteriota bacterium]|nr:asparagine synthase C-terminal domain-containing protein [Acidobacteriota bacterium]